ncbi:MAG: outer membrane beta-barrel protein [Bacteroidota bacterium]
MKKSALTGIFILIAAIVLAQSKFSLAINTQLSISTGSLTPLPHSEYVGAYFEEPISFSPPQVSYGGGLSFDYQISENWLGRTGINYQQSRTDIQEYSVYGGAHDLNTNYSNFKSNTYHQVQIPLSIVWQFGSAKYRPFLGGGILFHQFFQSDNLSTARLEQQTKLTPAQNSTIHWMINAGIRIHQKIGLELQHAFSAGDQVNTYSDFIPFPCAAIAGVPLTGPCGNHLNVYSPSIFRSFLALKVSYYLL